MTDTPKRVAGPAVGTAAEATIYTVPAVTTTIISSVRVVNTTTTSQTFKMSIGADAAGTRVYDDISVPADGFFLDDHPALVMAAAETLRWNGPATLTVTVCGVEIT